MEQRYSVYSTYLKEKYGEKVYKIPVNLPLTCPNRDGEVSAGGCTFCGDDAAGFECLDNKIEIKEQIKINIERIGKKYKAKKFIVYFQNFTNTYMPLSLFERYLEEACVENVVELCVSSRPDCVSEAYLDVLENISVKYGVKISIELGLQTVNYHTLVKVNRGHGLAEFLDAVLRIHKRNFETCVHLILNLPWDDEIDVLENARIISALGIRQVKIHSLYILRNTEMGRQYEAGEVEIAPVEEYVNRVVKFIRNVDSDVVFQRLAGRAPKEETLFCNWNMSWWRIKDMIDEEMVKQDAYQGDQCNYLNGHAVRKFENQ